MMTYSQEQIAAWIEADWDRYETGGTPTFRMMTLRALADIVPHTNAPRLARLRAEWDAAKLTPIRLRVRLDGNHRLTVARERGLHKLPALVWRE